MEIGGVKLRGEALKQMAPATTYVDAVSIQAGDNEFVQVPSGAIAVSFGYESAGAWVKFGAHGELGAAAKPGAVITDGSASIYAPTSRTIDSGITAISIHNSSASDMAVSLEWYLG